MHPITTHDEHIAALSLVDTLGDAPVGTPEFDALDSVVTQIENYEAKNYPIEPPDPIAAASYDREKQGQRPTSQTHGSASSTQ